MRVLATIKEMTWDVITSRDSNLEDKVFGVVMLVLISITSFLVLWFSYALVNEVAVTNVASVSKQMVSKKFTPAHQQTSLIFAGKVTIPQVRHIPDRWSLCFKFEQHEECGEVDQDTYNKAEIGQPFLVSYGVGRIDGKYIVNSVQ